jgi:VCBS repeat-containing protein
VERVVAKKIKPKILTFAQLCKIAPPTILTPNQSACVTELTDYDKCENAVTHTKSAVLKFKDTAGDVHKASVVPLGAKYLGNFALGPINQNTDSLVWKFTVNDSALDCLSCGETLIQKYLVTITDACGKKATTIVTVKIVGTNDAPCITSGPQIGKVTEISECAPPKCDDGCDDGGEVPAIAARDEGGAEGGDCGRGPKDDCGEGENEVDHVQAGCITFKDVDKKDTHSAGVEACGEGYLGTLVLGPLNQASDKVNWTFKVNDSVLDSLKPGETLTQVYKVTIYDNHGGKATTTVTIVICGTDDGVKILGLDAEGADICVYESGLPEDRGEGESAGSSPGATTTQNGSFSIDAPDGLDTVKIGGVTVIENGALVSGLIEIATAHGKITVTGFSGGVVSFTYTLLDNVINGPGEDYYMEEVQVVVTDEDGSCAKADIDIKIKDDVPSICPSDKPLPCLVVDETKLDDDACADFSGAFKSVPGADGATVAYALAIEGDATGLKDSETGLAVTLKEVGGVVYGVINEGLGNEKTVFILSVDSDGKITLDQQRAVEHDDPTNDDESISLAGDGKVLLVGTITDGDTDADTASVEITGAIKFEDDAPYAKDDCDYVEVAPIQVLTFDDINLPQSDEAPLLNYGGFTWGQTGVHNPTPPSNYVPTSGDQLAFFAEAGGSNVDGYPGNPGDPASATGSAFSFLGASFVSRNVPNMAIVVTGYLVGGGTVTKTIYAQQGVATYFDFSTYPEFAGKELLKVEFDAADYFGFDNFTTQPATPAATGNVVTGLDTDNVPDDDSNSEDGNADDLGADGFGSIAWDNQLGNNTVVGQYGTLYVDANGNYRYVVDANDPDVIKATAEGEELVEKFCYTVKDKDGDPDKATLTIKVTGANDPVTINGLGVDGGEQTVDEDDLSPDGSDQSGTVTRSGTFTIDAPDGVESFVIRGVTIALDGSNTDVGNRLVVSFNASTGTVSYTYTLDDNEGHPNANGQNGLSDSFDVVVTGNGGTSDTASLDITIIDDVPTAKPDVIEEPILDGAQVIYNVLANDTQGADSDAILVSATVDPALGTITGFTEAGEVTFVAANGYSGPVVINYTIRDTDGDTSRSTLTLTVERDSVPQIGETDSVVVDQDGLPNASGDGSPLHTGETDSTESASGVGSVVVDFGNDVPANLAAAIQLVDTGALDGQLQTLDGQNVTFALDGGHLVGTVSNGTVEVIRIKFDSVSTGPGATEATYTYSATLQQPVRHASNSGEDVDILPGVTFRVTDSDGSQQDGTFSVTVVDDMPLARNDTAEVQEGAKPTLNAVLVIDLSLSMDGSSGVPGFTRLELLQEAVENYLSSPDVTFKDIVIYTFNDGAILRGTFTDVAAAIAHVNSYDEDDLVAATEYDSALAAIQGNLPALQSADQTHLLFLSDGDPQGGSEVNGSEEAAWSSFLDTRGIDKVIAVGFGGIVNTGFLDPVAPRDEDDAIAVTNASQLEAVLEGTLPGEVSGNVLTNDGIPGAPTSDAFGSDAGYISELTVDGYTYTFNWTDITLGANPNGATVSGTELTVVTDLGGTLTFDFATGAWEYDAPPNGVAATTDEVFGYKLKDSDGDSSTATLTVKVVNVPNVPPVVEVNGTPSFTLGGTAVAVDSTIAITDTNNTLLAGATVTITNVQAGDVLSFTGQPGITGIFAAGVLTLSGTASLAAYEAVLESITFSTSSSNTTARTVSYVVNDGEANSVVDTATVSIIVPDHAPVVNDDLVITSLPAMNGQDQIVIPDYALLYNDTDADGQTITLTATAAVNPDSVVNNSNNTVTFVESSSNSDNGGSFTYTGSTTNPAASDTALVTVNREQRGFTTLTGGAGGEILLGSTAAETLNGMGGNDVLIGGDGATTASGTPFTFEIVADGGNVPDISFDFTGGTASDFVQSIVIDLRGGVDGDAVFDPDNPGANNGSGPTLSSTGGLGTITVSPANGGSTSATLTLSFQSGAFGLGEDFNVSIQVNNLGSDAGDWAARGVTATITLQDGRTQEVTFGTVDGNTSIAQFSIAGPSVSITDDTLNGGAGNDLLVGGGGNDIFLFNTALNAATNVDRINDFDANPAGGGQDFIHLENAIFSSLVSTGVLSAANFALNAAGDANDFIIFNTATGALSYDADGSGGGSSAVQFATINLAGLTGTVDNTDFFIV